MCLSPMTLTKDTMNSITIATIEMTCHETWGVIVAEVTATATAIDPITDDTILDDLASPRKSADAVGKSVLPAMKISTPETSLAATCSAETWRGRAAAEKEKGNEIEIVTGIGKEIEIGIERGIETETEIAIETEMIDAIGSAIVEKGMIETGVTNDERAEVARTLVAAETEIETNSAEMRDNNNNNNNN